MPVPIGVGLVPLLRLIPTYGRPVPAEPAKNFSSSARPKLEEVAELVRDVVVELVVAVPAVLDDNEVRDVEEMDVKLLALASRANFASTSESECAVLDIDDVVELVDSDVAEVLEAEVRFVLVERLEDELRLELKLEDNDDNEDDDDDDDVGDDDNSEEEEEEKDNDEEDDDVDEIVVELEVVRVVVELNVLLVVAATKSIGVQDFHFKPMMRFCVLKHRP